MGIRGSLLKLINRVIGHFDLKIIRHKDTGQPRKVFPRGNFFDQLDMNMPDTDQMTIFDIGAYNGMSAKRFHEIYPHARIHCFEPSPDSYNLLADMASMPEYSAQVIPHRLALSDRAGQCVLFRHQAPQTDSMLETHPYALTQWPDERFQPITDCVTEVETVDQFCSNEDIDYIEILKIDAQGEDFRILKGAESMLKHNSIGIIIVELYFVPVYQSQGQPHEIIHYLTSHGFTNITYLCHDVDSHGRLLCVDAVFRQQPLQ